MKQIPAILFALAAALPASAQEPPKAEAKSSKLVSSFDIAPDARNPFWPVGWVKPTKQRILPTEAPRVSTVIAAENFVVTSISLVPYRVAVINGKDYTEGDTMRVPSNSGEIAVKVVKVRDGGVVLRSADTEVVAPLRTR